MPAFTDRTPLENSVLAQLGFAPSGPTIASLDLPHYYWVSTTAGSDGAGNGRMSQPFATIKRAIRECVDQRGDAIIVSPGSYAETIEIGAGDTSFGSTSVNGYAKRNIKIVGAGGGHNGLVQIIGDGATAQATVKVDAGYLTGFMLMGVELDTNGVTQPAVHLVTSDSASTPTASSAYYRGAIEDVAIRSNDPSVAFLLEGTTLCNFKRLYINGPRLGIAFAGSALNMPSDLMFEDTVFINGFSNTAVADICNVQTAASPWIVGGGPNLTNVIFKRTDHHSVGTGAGGVTNFINFPSTATFLNVNFYDSNFPRAVTNGTNGIATLPANMRVYGWGNSTTRIAIAS